MKNIILLGDSIFDNGVYVEENCSVFDILKSITKSKVELLALDGNVTLGILQQIKSMSLDATHLFISCGGNDALRESNILNEPSDTIENSMKKVSYIIHRFRERYKLMLVRLIFIMDIKKIHKITKRLR